MADVIITPDMTLNDVIRRYPSTIGVFNRFNVDSCCGGARPLSQAAAEAGIDINEFLSALNSAAREG